MAESPNTEDALAQIASDEAGAVLVVSVSRLLAWALFEEHVRVELSLRTPFLAATPFRTASLCAAATWAFSATRFG
jgi:hypothetical protein